MREVDVEQVRDDAENEAAQLRAEAAAKDLRRAQLPPNERGYYLRGD